LAPTMKGVRWKKHQRTGGETRPCGYEGGSMTDRRDDERKRTEETDEHQREERDRRSDELREAWRRNHPSEQEEGRKDRTKRGHPA
jgi:hypothetical protein